MKIFKTISKIFQFTVAAIVYIIGYLCAIVSCFILFCFAIAWLWPELNGSYNLGNNIYMIEWDGGGRLIVEGTQFTGNTCYGGNRLLPINDSLGNFAEYVVDAKADDNWIIAKTDNKISKQRKYYILDKMYDPNKITAEDIINTKIKSFTDSCEFANTCSRNRIDIKW